MMEMETIYVCPNGCHAKLTCEADISSTWHVDLWGGLVEMVDHERPDMMFETPCCAECGAVAKELRCTTTPVLGEDGQQAGELYIEVGEDTGFGYYLAEYDDTVSRVELSDGGFSLDGVRYHRTEDGFVPRTELPGQETLF
ncbi:hypothetical protein [uncultured Flavonifractor sp.]|uniref:hypothetical protein n=1 Tax=uncultured Flavonifractor sp. TaxID=1193534 RepID=UPI002598261F|nr:hypothetical protein [uncultured Flavonifractor sp.]